jgi:hypothetical protein
MGFTLNEEITTKLNYKDIALIAVAFGEYQRLYGGSMGDDDIKRMRRLVDRLGREMADHPDNRKSGGSLINSNDVLKKIDTAYLYKVHILELNAPEKFRPKELKNYTLEDYQKDVKILKDFDINLLWDKSFWGLSQNDSISAIASVPYGKLKKVISDEPTSSLYVKKNGGVVDVYAHKYKLIVKWEKRADWDITILSKTAESICMWLPREEKEGDRILSVDIKLVEKNVEKNPTYLAKGIGEFAKGGSAKKDYPESIIGTYTKDDEPFLLKEGGKLNYSIGGL